MGNSFRCCSRRTRSPRVPSRGHQTPHAVPNLPHRQPRFRRRPRLRLLSTDQLLDRKFSSGAHQVACASQEPPTEDTNPTESSRKSARCRHDSAEQRTVGPRPRGSHHRCRNRRIRTARKGLVAIHPEKQDKRCRALRASPGRRDNTTRQDCSQQSRRTCESSRCQGRRISTARRTR
jgi:hypothetical protein